LQLLLGLRTLEKGTGHDTATLLSKSLGPRSGAPRWMILRSREAVRRGLVTEANHEIWWGSLKKDNGDLCDVSGLYGESYG